MVKAVIFDVDGTLVDSVDIHAEVWRQAFKQFGYDLRLQEIRSQIGKGGDQLMPVFMSDDEVKSHGAALEMHRSDILKSQYLTKIKGFPKVRELFKRLQAHDVEVVLASSAKGDELSFYKKQANIEDLVEAQTSSDDADKSKPHPDIFLSTMDRLDGIAPDDIVVVGDTPYDAEAASKAGLRTIGVLCGGFSGHDLRQAGCVAIYRDPADLLAHYVQSPLGDDCLNR